MKFADDNNEWKALYFKHQETHSEQSLKVRFATASYTLRQETIEACDDIWHCRQKKLCTYSTIT